MAENPKSISKKEKDILSSQNEIAERIDSLYSDLQNCYQRWARQFKTYEDVVEWLTQNGIKCTTIRKQYKFNMFSSHWNSITIKVLKILVPDTLNNMKFELLKLTTNDGDTLSFAWYFLYFIHPVRHELYYYNEHFPQGHNSRLISSLRSHRMGLKAAKNYLNADKSRGIDDAFLNGCGTIAFKQIHLHPLTILWKQSGGIVLNESIRRLEISNGPLSAEEKNIALALSKKGTMTFENWINYAPCSINEGPIFTAKAGKRLSDLLIRGVEMLVIGDVSESRMRALVNDYFKVQTIRL